MPVPGPRLVYRVLAVGTGSFIGTIDAMAGLVVLTAEEEFDIRVRTLLKQPATLQRPPRDQILHRITCDEPGSGAA